MVHSLHRHRQREAEAEVGAEAQAEAKAEAEVEAKVEAKAGTGAKAEAGAEIAVRPAKPCQAYHFQGYACLSNLRHLAWRGGVVENNSNSNKQT
jgi:membrane protein involved in colicin uptake